MQKTASLRECQLSIVDYFSCSLLITSFTLLFGLYKDTAHKFLLFLAGHVYRKWQQRTWPAVNKFEKISIHTAEYNCSILSPRKTL